MEFLVKNEIMVPKVLGGTIRAGDRLEQKTLSCTEAIGNGKFGGLFGG